MEKVFRLTSLRACGRSAMLSAVIIDVQHDKPLESVMKKKAGKMFRRRLRFESLESRAMLAGNVIAEVLDNGDLQITGDLYSDSIDVEGQMVDGAREYNITGNDGTTVNGGTDNAPLTVTGNVIVNMGDGDNIVTVADTTSSSLSFTSGAGSDQLSVLGSDLTGLAIDGGDGVNTFLVGGTNVSGSLSVTGGDGGNTVIVDGSNIGAGVTISTGAGSDSLLFNAVTVQGDTTVSTGAGGDSVTSTDATFGGNLSVSTGAGDDFVVIGAQTKSVNIGGGLLIMTSDGADVVQLFGEIDVTGSALIATGTGDDSVSLNDVTVETNLYIFSGDDNDTVTLSHVLVTGDTWVQTGGGNDVVLVDNSSTFGGSFIVTMGGGNDLLEIHDSIFNGSAIVYGGSGTDTLTSNQLIDLAILSFEET